MMSYSSVYHITQSDLYFAQSMSTFWVTNLKPHFMAFLNLLCELEWAIVANPDKECWAIVAIPRLAQWCHKYAS